MPFKPVITIDVDDSQFKAFNEAYNKYRESVKDMPEGWKQANDVLNAGLAAVVEQSHTINQHMRESIKLQKTFGEATHTGEKNFGKMAKSAKVLVDSLHGLERMVVRLGGLGIGGLGLAAGGLFGLDRLGGAITEQHTQARSLVNTRTGALRAFQVGMRGIAPAQLPQSVANAQETFEGRLAISSLTGLSQRQVASMSSVNVAQDLVKAAREYAQRNKGNPLAFVNENPQMQFFREAGLDRGAVMNIGNASARLYGFDMRHTSAMIASNMLGTSSATDLAFRSLQFQLAKLGREFETDLGTHLAGLAKTLSPIVSTLGTIGSTLLSDALSPANMRAIDNGLKEFEGALKDHVIQNGIAKFGAELQSLVPDMHALGAAVRAVAAIPNWLHSTKNDVENLPANLKTLLGPHWASLGFIGGANVRGGASISSDSPSLHQRGSLASWFDHVLGISARRANVVNLNAGALGNRVRNGNRVIGFPGYLQAIASVESSDNANALNRSGAAGLYQLMPAVARQFHVNPFNPLQATLGAVELTRQNERVLAPFLRHAGGVTQMEVLAAAHNEGAGALATQLRRYGSFNAAEPHMEGSVQTYVSKFLSAYIRNGLGTLAAAHNPADKQTVPLLRSIDRHLAKIAGRGAPSTSVAGQLAVQANAAAM